MSAHASSEARLNDLEVAILSRLPLAGLQTDIANLMVTSRELTGAGSYTNFVAENLSPMFQGTHIVLEALIEIPGVPNGLGAALWILAAGCSSISSKAPITAEQMCILDRPEPWTQISSAPDFADRLVALADASPIFPNRSMSLPTTSCSRHSVGVRRQTYEERTPS